MSEVLVDAWRLANDYFETRTAVHDRIMELLDTSEVYLLPELSYLLLFGLNRFRRASSTSALACQDL